MTFSDETKQAVRQRARGICECLRTTCPHYGRCKNRGSEFFQRSPTFIEGDEMRICQLLCKPCLDQALHSSEALGRV